MSFKIEAATDAVATHAPVGGGHLTFLTALTDASYEAGFRIQILNPLQTGHLPTRFLWRIFERAYEIGSQGGLKNTLYELTRRNSDKGSLLINLARLELIRTLADYKGPVIADHAYASTGRGYLIQSDVGAEKPYADKKSIVFVPVREAVDQLIAFGHPEELTRQVGFFVPPQIIDENLKQKRLDRMMSGYAHIGFFGTGASPGEHYAYLENNLLPNLKDLITQDRVKLTVYTWTNSQKGQHIEKLARSMGLKTSINMDDAPDGNWDVRVLWGKTPMDAVGKSVAAVADIDYLVTMLGERTAWTHDVPAAALTPINFNARSNTNWAVKNGIVRPPKTTDCFVPYLAEQLKSGAPDIRGRLDRAQTIPVFGAKEASQIIFQQSK